MTMQAVRAKGWTVAHASTNQKEFSHLFYHAADVEKLIEQHEFEIRRWKALEQFYLLELKRD